MRTDVVPEALLNTAVVRRAVRARSVRTLSLTRSRALSAARQLRVASPHGHGRDAASIILLGLLAAVIAVDLGDKLFASPAATLIEIAEVALVVLVFLRFTTLARREARSALDSAALVANASDALAVIGEDGIIRLANPAAQRLIGVPLGLSMGRPIMDFLELLHPDERADNAARLHAVLGSPGTSSASELRVRQTDGTYRWLYVTATNRVADPAVSGVVMTFRDINDERQSAHRLTRLATAIEQTSEAVVVAGVDANIEYVNPAFVRITGYAAEEVIGRNPRLLASGRQSAAFYRAMWDALTNGRPWTAEFVNKRKDGTEYLASSVISPIRDEGGTISGYVAVSRDVSSERRQEELAKQLARERTLIAETIREMDTRGSPELIAQGVCSQVASLTDFTLTALFIFETDGQAAPYGLVMANGEAISPERIPVGRARYLFDRCSRGPWIEGWRSRRGHPHNEIFRRLGVKATAYAPVRDGQDVIGCLLVNSSHEHAEQVLSGALPALVEFADISGTLLGAKVVERTQVSAARLRLHTIVDQGLFHPLFQPIVDVEINRVVGYEALTRFDDGVAPDVRFSEAAALGMAHEVEIGAIRRILADAKDLSEDVWLSINISPEVLSNDAELATLVAASNRRLIIEVTEHKAIDNYAAIRDAVHRLGPSVRLAIDDAGAGFASMRHIVELRPAFVKLDRAVIAGIDHDEARRALAVGMRQFARTAGFWIIAEGIETEAEMATLRHLDIHFMQGYLLGRPAPAHWKADPDVPYVAGAHAYTEKSTDA